MEHSLELENALARLAYLEEVVEEFTDLTMSYRAGQLSGDQAIRKVIETLVEVNCKPEPRSDTQPMGSPPEVVLSAAQKSLNRMIQSAGAFQAKEMVSQGYSMDSLIENMGLITKKGAVEPPVFQVDAKLVEDWLHGSWDDPCPKQPGKVDVVISTATSEDALGECSEQFDELVRAEVKIIEADAENKRLRQQLSELRATIKAIKGAINDVEPTADDKVATIEGLIALIQ